MLAINPIIIKKIEDSDYDPEIKEILRLVLDYEDSRESLRERTYTSQYDKIISTYVKL